ncbi:MAG: protein kinase [Acidobacteria bacterium]|nr:protein kinase [Acidobacteriota bacterium]
MTGFEKLEKYTLLQQEEQHPLFTSYRAGEVEGGRLTQHVRLDIINPDISASPGFIDQVTSQSMITAKMEHTNVSKKLTVVQQGTTLASVYEYLEGFSLHTVLDRSRSEGFPFSIDHALLVANKLANALAYAKSKNINHGLVHPAFVFITNEGEIKLKGFAASSGIKSVLSSHNQVEQFLSGYLPDSQSAMGGAAERLDIFATGLILFEMLTGQQFFASGRGGDARQRIQSAETAADMEPIPESIAKILMGAIVPDATSAYTDVQVMAREIESLIFSGEYSPTTFNLAFFMHSAFRTDIESINAQIKRERETVFEGQAAMPKLPSPSGSPATSGVIMPSASGHTGSGVVSASIPEKKSNKGLLIGGILAAVVVVAVAAVFLMPKKEADTTQEKFEAQKEQLLADRERAQLEAEKEKEEMLRLEVEALRAQIEEQNKADKEVEAEQYKSEIDQINEKIEAAKARAALEAQLKEQQRQLEELQRQSELERKRLEEERAKLSEAQAKNQQTQQEKPPATKPTPAETQPAKTEDKPAEVETAKTTTNKPTPAETKPEPEPESTMAAKDVVPAQPNKATKVATPPEEGELVEIDDTVTQPVLQDTLKYLSVPSKAVKNGAVREGEVKTFLVKALVDERGRVTEVEMVRNPMANYEDDYDMPDKALKHASKLKFSPAEKMGVKVKVWTHVGIHFKAM